MNAPATLPSLPSEESRATRAARAGLRIAVFMMAGVAAALAISWVVARWPALGTVLGVLGLLLLARSIARLFTSASPVQAATQLGISMGLGAAVSALTALIVR